MEYARGTEPGCMAHRTKRRHCKRPSTLVSGRKPSVRHSKHQRARTPAYGEFEPAHCNSVPGLDKTFRLILGLNHNLLLPPAHQRRKSIPLPDYLLCCRACASCRQRPKAPHRQCMEGALAVDNPPSSLRAPSRRRSLLIPSVRNLPKHQEPWCAQVFAASFACKRSVCLRARDPIQRLSVNFAGSHDNTPRAKALDRCAPLLCSVCSYDVRTQLQ